VAPDAGMEELQRIVNHVFLPPKLPQGEDASSDVALLDATFQQSIEVFAKSDCISSRPDKLICRAHSSPFTRYLSSTRTHDLAKADDISSC
jgi:hypothetical protein